MTRKIKFTKQYKPMGFGDRDDRGSVEAYVRSKEEAWETRLFNRRMKELEAEEAERNNGGWLSKLLQYLTNFPSKKRR